jgi:ABC-type phosphate transport system substrate-binding protein
MNRLFCLLVFASMVLAAPPSRAEERTLPPVSQATSGNDVAIVASPDVPVDDLSLPDLRKILLGDRQYWNPNLRVTLLIRAPVARERDVVLKIIYQMSEAQFRQYWIGKVFRAETANGPRIVYSNEMATEMVSTIPGAIAFVDATQLPKNVKVIKTNGLLPGEKGYPLH